MKVSLIGAGTMGEALTRGFLEKKVLQAKDCILSDVRAERLDHLKKLYKVQTASSNREAVEQADLMIVAVKPQILDAVLEELQDFPFNHRVIVSIVAGVSTHRYYEVWGREIKIVRVMPNTPALVGWGVAAISPGLNVSQDELEKVVKLFEAVGEVVVLEEKYQDEAMALNGCGPAYFYLFAESLIQAGIRSGLNRETATKLVVGTMLGAAFMLKETGKHPALLIDMVTSPGGTTISALEAFERKGLRATVFEAVEAAIRRARELR